MKLDTYSTVDFTRGWGENSSLVQQARFDFEPGETGGMLRRLKSEVMFEGALSLLPQHRKVAFLVYFP